MQNDERTEQTIPECYKARFTCISNKPLHVSAKQRERMERAIRREKRDKRRKVIIAILAGVFIGLIVGHAGYILYYLFAGIYGWGA